MQVDFNYDRLLPLTRPNITPADALRRESTVVVKVSCTSESCPVNVKAIHIRVANSTKNIGTETPSANLNELPWTFSMLTADLR